MTCEAEGKGGGVDEHVDGLDVAVNDAAAVEVAARGHLPSTLEALQSHEIFCRIWIVLD